MSDELSELVAKYAVAAGILRSGRLQWSKEKLTEEGLVNSIQYTAVDGRWRFLVLFSKTDKGSGVMGTVSAMSEGFMSALRPEEAKLAVDQAEAQYAIRN